MMLRAYPTDLLFLATVLGLSLWVGRALRSGQQARAFQKLGQSPVALVSMILLSLHLAVAVLDSIRIEQRGVTLSLLDLALTPIRTAVERSYSEPLSSVALAQEAVIRPNGETVWTRPRLLHGGPDPLAGQGDASSDLQRRLWKGLALGLLSASLMLAPLILWTLRRSQRSLGSLWRGEVGWPIRSVIVTVLILGGGFGLTISLAGGYHVLGTDKVGADVLYQGLKGIRTGLLIGLLTTVTTLPLSVSLGVLAGYYRGWVDDLIQFLYTALNAMPSVLLIAASMLVMEASLGRSPELLGTPSARADLRLLALCLILGMTSWTSLCRLIRAETLKLSRLEFVQAAKVLGVSGPRILWRHVWPNLSHLILISVALDFSGLVLAEAVLSYVNIGVDPTTESWGNMINTARLELAREPVVWWSLATAFLFMLSLVLPANLLAEALRDAFDPRRE